MNVWQQMCMFLTLVVAGANCFLSTRSLNHNFHPNYYPFVKDAIVAGAVVLLGLAGVALSSQQGSGSSSSEPTAPSKQQAAAVNVPPPPDLSIPYDAAARLAFAEWKGTNEATYAKFQPLYEAKAVAEATAKKVARDALHEEKRYTDIAGQAVKDIEALLAA